MPMCSNVHYSIHVRKTKKKRKNPCQSKFVLGEGARESTWHKFRHRHVEPAATARSRRRRRLSFLWRNTKKFRNKDVSAIKRVAGKVEQRRWILTVWIFFHSLVHCCFGVGKSIAYSMPCDTVVKVLRLRCVASVAVTKCVGRIFLDSAIGVAA